MTYRGHVKNGVVVLDEPVRLAEGATVDVVPVEAKGQEPAEVSESGPTIWEKLSALAGSAEGLPADAARNHDHYLYGTPKRKTGE
ncbi:MAG: hypothetical protein JWN24_3344 [Phycisphaerales bacterium]|nr:hypothetical protein [Phycisphaerales bacterium]